MVVIEPVPSTNGIMPKGFNPIPDQSMAPMPAEAEVLKEFEEVLKMMDLPPDKMRTLRSYDLNKKWKLVCDQRLMYTVTDPSVYLQKLAMYLDKKALKKNKKLLGDETSTEILKHIEISLRTNSIDWVRSFLSDKNNGLKILVDYMTQLQESLPSFSVQNLDQLTASTSYSPSPYEHNQSGFSYFYESSNKFDQSTTGSISSFNASPHSDSKASTFRKAAMSSSSSLTSSKTKLKNMGDPEVDIHVCVSCLRAIMNNKYGFNMVFNDPQAIYCIAKSILHPTLRTKALVVELLSAICLVKDGHGLIMDAFNRFRVEYKEAYRFQTLMHFFRYPSEFHLEFMSACMQFFNVLVHSVEDLNYRVFLQYEFTLVGLDDYLDLLSTNESEQLQTQRKSYLDNMIDVAALINESVEKQRLSEENMSLRFKLSQTKEHLQEVEADYITRNAQLAKRLNELNMEKEKLVRDKEEKIENLTRTMREADRIAAQKYAKLEEKIKELEDVKKNMEEGLKLAQKPAPATKAPPQVAQKPTNAPAAPPPPPAPPLPMETQKKEGTPIRIPVAPPPPPAPISQGGPAPPPPPPPPPMLLRTGGGIPPPPPPPNFLQPPANDVRTIKRIVQTKNKLPMLNWTALKPNQVKNTVFNNLDDEKLIDQIDFAILEEKFKIGNQDTGMSESMIASQHSPGSSTSGSTVKESNNTLLSTKRLQNIAITRRKIGKDVSEIMAAVHRFDLSVLPQDHVDILIPIVPTDEEVEQFKDYSSRNNGSYDGLSVEDQFMAQLMNIERLAHKLKIMSFMAGFEESVRLIEPQLKNITAASKCIEEATLFHKVLEVVLAFGNYMNSSRKGASYGFKLASLDTLAILKSPTDRSMTLMHVIADTISKKFPELMKFPEQLKFAENASGVSLESLLIDIRDLESKYNLATKELELKGDEAPANLRNFVEKAKPIMESLLENCKLATDAFASCVEFYGESPRSQQPNAFFPRLFAFAKNFRQAAAENEQRQALEQRKKDEQERREKAAKMKTRLTKGNEDQSLLIDELNEQFKHSNNGNRGLKKTKSRLFDSSQIGDGDFERIMHELKDGYVAFDGPPVPAKRTGKSTSPSRRHHVENGQKSAAISTPTHTSRERENK